MSHLAVCFAESKTFTVDVIKWPVYLLFVYYV
jgi:hypothetical protein